jgi:hypothetical protein
MKGTKLCGSTARSRDGLPLTADDARNPVPQLAHLVPSGSLHPKLYATAAGRPEAITSRHEIHTNSVEMLEKRAKRAHRHLPEKSPQLLYQQML